MEKNTYRSSLGRSGYLGATYDIRSDTFQSDNIFKKRLGYEDIYSTKIGKTEVEVVMSDSLDDKFHQLDIEAELAVSFISGLVKVSGSGKYLDESRKSAKQLSMSLIYNVQTKTEEVSIRQLKEKVDLDALNTSGATHVLTAIDWGAACTVTAQYEVSNESQKKNIEGALNAELNKLKGVLDVHGKAKLDFKENFEEKSESFRFIVKSDVGSSGQDLPVTFQEAVNLAKSLPTLVKETNEEKGVPVKFTLTPLSLVRQWLNQENTVNVLYKFIKEESLKRIVDVSKNMNETKLRLNDLQTELEEGKSCVSDTERECIKNLVTNFTTREAKFKGDLQVILQEIRSAKKDVSELDKLNNEILEGEFSPTKLNRQMKMFDVAVNKIAEVQKLEISGIDYYGKGKTIDYNAYNEVYVFYTEDLLKKKDILNYFSKLKKTVTKQKSNILFCIVDLSVGTFPKDEKELITNKIVHYRKGKKITSDVKAALGENVNMCLMKFNGGRLCEKIPNNRAAVSLSCPDGYNEEADCSTDIKSWLCCKCGGTIWYGLETKMFYCEKCKKQCEPVEATYRCDEDSHDLNFVKYPEEYLWNAISKFRESKILNILILGETGVGKSTWINAFANQLYFDSLDEASKQPPVVAIPSKFTITKHGVITNVSIGDPDDNELNKVGASNTQGCKTYPFRLKDYMVNLIDTPGIGDTRGSKQDDKNMDNILSHISYYQEIHAILILLKPNDARLGIFFRHCIQQLLTHLHKSATDNIVFVFTNTHSTMYEPGETLPSLRELLKVKKMNIEAVSQNMFCYDSESFRTLAIMLNKIELSPAWMKQSEQSWQYAVDETKRLLHHIKSLTPHKVRDTTTLNEARRVIVELSRPLNEFATNIKENITKFESQKKKAASLGNKVNDYYSKLTFEGITLEQRDLKYPRTVCTHEDCIEVVAEGKDGIPTINYIKHCHEECYLKGDRPEVVGDVLLMDCRAMEDNYCKECTHKYTWHMHRTYDLIKINKSFVCESVKVKLVEKMTKKEIAEKNKKELEELIDELKEEEIEIQNIAAEFAAFLKTFAILPFNDAMGEYIETQIELEEGQSEGNTKKTLVKEWRLYKEQYEKQRKILEDALDKTKDTDQGRAKAASSIKALKDRAFKLKHFGKEIMQIYNNIEERKKVMPNFKQAIIPVPSSANTKNKSYMQRFTDGVKSVFYNY